MYGYRSEACNVSAGTIKNIKTDEHTVATEFVCFTYLILKLMRIQYSLYTSVPANRTHPVPKSSKSGILSYVTG